MTDPRSPSNRRTPLQTLRRRTLPFLGRFVVVGALLQIVGWAVGRRMNDDAFWSQFFWWLPSGFVALCAWGAWLISRVCEALSTRLAGAKLRPFLVIGAAFCTLWTLATWRPDRYLDPTHDAAATQARIAYWNAGWYQPHGVADVLDDVAADIVIMANTRGGTSKQELDRWLADTAKGWKRERSGGADQNTATDTPTLHLVQPSNYMTIVSRWPIVDHGSSPIELSANSRTARNVSRFQVGVFFVTLDMTEDLGDTATIWIVDLPSDPMTHRRVMMQRARAAAEQAGFPEPDIILGDFNTPRGSRSLPLLTGTMTEAYRSIGRGPSATWPTPFPQFAIDQIYTATPWKPTTLGSRALQHGLHRMLIAGIAREGTPNDTEPAALTGDAEPDTISDPISDPISDSD